MHLIFFLLGSIILQIGAFESKTIVSPIGIYTLQKELGEGAFGKVFAANDASGKLYAIKWYKNESSEKNHRYQDNEREYRRGQLFFHENIIKSIETFTTSLDDGAYTVLEYVDGKTIFNTEKRSLSLIYALNLIQQLILGLKHAYIQGFIHLDLHANNVMQNKAGTLKVIDIASFYSFEELIEMNSSNITLSITAPKIKKLFARHPFLKEQSVLSVKTSPIDAYLTCNFDDITELAAKILHRADLSYEIRLGLRAKIKRLAWECQEDLAEEKRIDLENYLNQLNTLVIEIEHNL